VSCWGLNHKGQLGLPPPALRDTPTQVAAGSWNALSAGPGYTCGAAAGVLQCWGDNSAGQLADGSRTDRASGTTVGDRRWKAVFAEHGTHACAQRDDDTTWCWGAGGNGQLGDGQRREALVPVREASSWTQAAVTAESTCFIGPDLTLACRGDDTYGQLGTGGAGRATEALGMVAGGPWVRMSGGRSFVCAIDEGSRLWCWGQGVYGQLGNGSGAGSPIPVIVDGVRTWSAVSGGGEFACGVDGGGVLSCWGYNVYGQLGNGSTVQANTPVPVAGLPAQVWRAVSAGSYHACAIDQLGLLRCWGYNAYGQVGNGSTITVPAPAQITTEAWTAVSAGLTHTCGIRPPGTLWCWGSNSRGELGDGGANPTGSLVPVRIGNSEDWLEVAAGQQLTCGVRAGGSLWCWGLGDWGTLGNGAVADTDEPTQVGTDAGWSRLVLRHLHACAVRDGTTWCWGQNRSGQLGSSPWRLSPAPVVP
jgi:alpha-tubulin suppressor-like RCC1 family protein